MQEPGDGVLYNELHNVVVKKKPNEEKECIFRITIEHSRGHIGKALNFKITDDYDSTFLFSLLLTQEDFSVLKSEQGLRVDFENFPRQFTKLLIDCKSCNRNQFTLMLEDTDIDSYQSSKFNSNGLFLKIIERNEFKYLCHLSLRVAPGTDEDIKQHLNCKLKTIRDQLNQEKQKNSRIESELSHCTNLLAVNQKQLNELEVKLVEEKSNIRIEASEQLSVEREKHSLELKELEAKHECALAEMKSNVDLLTHKNRMCHEAKSALESSLSERTVQKETLEKDVARLMAENMSLKASMSNLEQKYSETEQILSATKRKLSALDEANKEITAVLNKVQREAISARENECRLNASLSHCERQLKVSSSKLIQARQEAEHLKEELDAKRKKIGNMLSVAQMLEGQLDSTKAELSVKTTELEAANKSRSNLEGEVVDLRSKLENAEQKLKEHDDTIKRQYDVNSYLHRKLNEVDTAQCDASKAKTQSFSTSLIAKNLPSLGANSTSVGASILSLPPWLTGNGNTQELLRDNQTLPSETPVLKPRIDPSYLLPDKETRPKTATSKPNIGSAYFPRLSARKNTP